jgi:pyruvate kinase
MSKIGISLNSATTNEASVATFARSGASYVRFIAKGITPQVYVSLAVAFLKCGRAIQPDFDLLIDLPGHRPRMGNTFEELPIFQGMTALLVDQASANEPYRSNLVVPTVQLLNHRDAIRRGDRLLVNDGATELKVLEVLPNGLLVEATRAEALLSPNRSILLPDSNIKYRSLSESDLTVIDAVAGSAPLSRPTIALSMVESAEPIQQVRELLPECHVIAKIETRQGLINRAEVIEAADAIMLARGDLSLSLGVNLLPAAVDLVMKDCTHRDRDMVLATGVLEGVSLQGRPTIPDLTDLWYYWCKGLRNFLISGGQPDKHGRQSLHSLQSALQDFRFATDDLLTTHD